MIEDVLLTKTGQQCTVSTNENGVFRWPARPRDQFGSAHDAMAGPTPTGALMKTTMVNAVIPGRTQNLHPAKSIEPWANCFVDRPRRSQNNQRVPTSNDSSSVALSSGNTPRTLYRLLSTRCRDQIPLINVHVFRGDEIKVVPKASNRPSMHEGRRRWR